MKKALKVIGIIFAVILVLLLIFMCFPWVFTTGIIEKKCPHLPDKMETREAITAEIPADWVSATVNGITVRGPEKYKNDNKFIPFREKNEFSVIVMRFDQDDTEMSAWEKFLFACTDSFYKKLGYDPDTMTEYDELVVVRNLDISQYKGTWGMQAAGFVYLAWGKELVTPIETLYYYDHKGTKCFFTDYGEGKNYKYNYGLCVTGGDGCTVMVKGNDENEVLAAIASIELPEELK